MIRYDEDSAAGVLGDVGNLFEMLEIHSLT